MMKSSNMNPDSKSSGGTDRPTSGDSSIMDATMKNIHEAEETRMPSKTDDPQSSGQDHGSSIAPKILAAGGAITGAVGQAASATANAIYNVVAGPGPVTTGTEPGTDFHEGNKVGMSSTHGASGDTTTSTTSRADEGPFLQGVRTGAEATRNAPSAAADMAHRTAETVSSSARNAADQVAATGTAAASTVSDTANSAWESTKQAGGKLVDAIHEGQTGPPGTTHAGAMTQNKTGKD